VPTSLTLLDPNETAEIQGPTSQVIVIRRIIAAKSAQLEVKADSTLILPALQDTQANTDLHFGPDAHPPSVPAGQALNIKNTGMVGTHVWVHWELQ
jgi:hypothetical protein